MRMIKIDSFNAQLHRIQLHHLTFALLSLILSCNQNNVLSVSKQANQVVGDTVVKPVQNTENLQTVDTDGVQIGYEDMQFNGNLNKIEKDINSDITCEQWQLSRSDLENILLDMEQVESVEWGALCYTYSCYYEGLVSNKEGDYKIVINAASHVTISSENSTSYFIAKAALPYFLQSCDCCE